MKLDAREKYLSHAHGPSSWFSALVRVHLSGSESAPPPSSSWHRGPPRPFGVADPRDDRHGARGRTVGHRGGVEGKPGRPRPGYGFPGEEEEGGGPRGPETKGGIRGAGKWGRIDGIRGRDAVDRPERIRPTRRSPPAPGFLPFRGRGGGGFPIGGVDPRGLYHWRRGPLGALPLAEGAPGGGPPRPRTGASPARAAHARMPAAGRRCRRSGRARGGPGSISLSRGGARGGQTSGGGGGGTRDLLR